MLFSFPTATQKHQQPLFQALRQCFPVTFSFHCSFSAPLRRLVEMYWHLRHTVGIVLGLHGVVLLHFMMHVENCTFQWQTMAYAVIKYRASLHLCIVDG